MKLYKRIKEDPILSGIIYTIVASLIISISSKVFKGDWFELFLIIPIWVWLIFLFIIIYIFIFLLKSKEKNKQTELFGFIPLRGWKELYSNIHYGVSWSIRIPQKDIFDKYLNTQTNPGDLNVKVPPYCPKCDTELKEQTTLFRSYKWYCVKCGFSKKNKNSFYILADDVRRIEQSSFRKFIKDNDSFRR